MSPVDIDEMDVYSEPDIFGPWCDKGERVGIWAWAAHHKGSHR